MARTYDQRLKALGEVVERHATTLWDDTTSFYVFASGSSRSSLARDIRAVIDPRIDLVLIGGMEAVGATVIGTSSDEGDLKALIPDLVKT